MNIRYTWKPAPTTWLSILLLALLFPLGLSLSGWWGWENRSLEKIIILGYGLPATLLAADHNRHEWKIRNLWLWLTPFWLVCIGRELSWGQVFYPVSIGVHGPEFISIHQLWYRPLVKPLVAIAIIVMVVGIGRNNPSKYLRQTAFPLIDIVILFLTAILSTWFDKNTIPLLHPCEEVLDHYPLASGNNHIP